MKAKVWYFLGGMLVAVVLGAVLLGGYVMGIRIPRTYTVHSVVSHYPNDERDTQTEINVYRRGDSGHVREIFCHFPPGFQLSEAAPDTWTGISRVRVGSVAERYALGYVAFICNRVE